MGFAVVGPVLLGLVFVVAGLEKLRDRGGTVRTIREFGLPGRAAPPLAIAVPIAELAVGASLATGVAPRVAAAGALLLLLAFSVAIGASLKAGRRPDCRCFGQLHSARVGGRTLARNAGLAAVAVLPIVVPPSPRSPASLAAVVVTIATFALGRHAAARVRARRTRTLETAPEFALPQLDGPAVALEELRSSGRPVLLAFVDPGCAACATLVPLLASWHLGGELNVAVVSRGAAEANAAKFGGYGFPVLLQEDWEVAASFGVGPTPTAVLVSDDGRLIAAPASGSAAIRQMIDAHLRPGTVQDATERAAAEPAARGERARGPGTPVPAMACRTLDGRHLALPDLATATTTVLLFWNPSCGYCGRLLPRLREWEAARTRRAPGLVLVSRDGADHTDLGLASPVVLDDGSIARALGGMATPSAVRIDRRGRVASAVAVGGDQVLALLSGQVGGARVRGGRIIARDWLQEARRGRVEGTISRREALRMVGAAVAAISVVRLVTRLPKARAEAGACECNGLEYDPRSMCCSSDGPVSRRPIEDLDACPNRQAPEGYDPSASANGCGPADGFTIIGVNVVPLIPDDTTFAGGADFSGACRAHDICYNTCRSDQQDCDNTFRADLDAACRAQWAEFNPLRATCLGYAALYHTAVTTYGKDAWEAGQKEGCECCPCELTDECCPDGQTADTETCRCKCGESDSCGQGEVCCHGECCDEYSLCCGEECCPEDQECCDGTCCAFREVCCDGACADLKTDGENCGTCGHVCAEDEVCDEGVCRKPCEVTCGCRENLLAEYCCPTGYVCCSMPHIGKSNCCCEPGDPRSGICWDHVCSPLPV